MSLTKPVKFFAMVNASFPCTMSAVMARSKNLNVVPTRGECPYAENFCGLTYDWENQKAHEKQVILWLGNIYIQLKLRAFQHLSLVG
jgi:hypothetical protein